VIEDYYPLDIVAEVINRDMAPSRKLTEKDFDATVHGKTRLANFKKVMHECQAGDSVERLKTLLGGTGTRLMQQRGMPVDDELQKVFRLVQEIVAAQ
jgi:hypothetical protein